MKKDGIQTRNRKMSTKSKKGRKNCAPLDMLKPPGLDKPFNGFSPCPPNFSPGMHAPMPTYMSVPGSLGGSFMSAPQSGPPPPPPPPPPHNTGYGGGYGTGFPSLAAPPPPPHSSPFPGMPSSGLNLSTNSSMIGTMA